MKKSFSGIDETVSGATDGINAAINSGKEFYDQMSEIIDSAFSSNSQSADDVAGTLNTLASRVQKVIDSYTSLKSAIDEINVGNNAQLNALKGSISGKLERRLRHRQSFGISLSPQHLRFRERQIQQ